MPEVVVSFLDGEVLYGELPQLHMDDPFVDLALHTLDGNARQALVPVSGVRQIDLTKVAQLGDKVDLKKLARVALHFIDGQVLRAHVVTPASLQRFGSVWDIIDAMSREHKICAIPYTALKGAFYVRRWDTRPPLERSSSVTQGQSGQRRRLAEIQARRNREGVSRRLPRPAGGLMDRVEPEAGPPTKRRRTPPGPAPAPPDAGAS
ncbi:MAG TPA: hypothetical protein VNF24_06325 [Candidatus Acidoferrales bacterium]|nr:hypothetical protein [Candidatus Acidoferrales bacterium]